MIYLLKTTTGCGVDEFCSDVGIKKTLRYVGYVIFSLKIIIPLLIIIMATIDLSKAIGTDDNLKPSIISVLKRIAAGLIIFFVPQIVLNVIDIIDNSDKLKTCATCLFEPFECNDLENPIKCENLVKSISISNCSKGSMTIYKNASKSLYIKYNPSDADNTGVKYSSSDKKIANVDSSGYVKAKKVGSATITAKLKDDESIKSTCKINVKESPNISSSGGSASDGKYTYYAQCDFQWQQYSFCGYSPCNTACGAFSLTMVINNLTDSSMNPNKMMNWLCRNGHGGGAMGTKFFDALNPYSVKLQNTFNLKTTNLNSGGSGYPSSSVFNEMSSRLKKGEMLICLVPYHFITLAGDSAGNVYVLDPGKRDNNKTYSNVEDAYKAVYNYWHGKNGNQWYGGVWAYSKK